MMMKAAVLTAEGKSTVRRAVLRAQATNDCLCSLSECIKLHSLVRHIGPRYRASCLPERRCRRRVRRAACQRLLARRLVVRVRAQLCYHPRHNLRQLIVDEYKNVHSMTD